MSDTQILILSHQAEAYAELIGAAPSAPLRVYTQPPPASVLATTAVMLADPDLAAPLLTELPRLRWLQSTWAGVTPLVKQPARHYRLTNVKGVFGPLMSEYVFAHLLAHERQLLDHHRANRERRWLPRQPGVIRGKTMGLMGIGSIGQHLAGTARHFGLRVLGYSRSGGHTALLDAAYGPAALTTMLAQCDYLVASLPSTLATRNLLDAEALAALKPGALLINVGRSNVLDEQALVEALERGHLAAAVLDVLRQEPLPAEHPLWRAPRLTITSHTAAPSRAADIVPIFLDNYRRYRAGETLRFEVDFARGY